MNNSDDISIIPIFPISVVCIKMNEDFTFFNNIDELEFTSIKSDESSNSFKSINNDIFSFYHKEKDIIKNYFDDFKNKILRLETNEFDISSSWATKTDYLGFSHYHDHKNSYYSGVYYPEQTNNGGELQFQNHSNLSSFLLNPVEYNDFNYEVFYIKPEKHTLIFFPSYLKHRINKLYDKQSRYSVAFNFVPVGKFGIGDSVVNYRLWKDN